MREIQEAGNLASAMRGRVASCFAMPVGTCGAKAG